MSALSAALLIVNRIIFLIFIFKRYFFVDQIVNCYHPSVNHCMAVHALGKYQIFKSHEFKFAQRDSSNILHSCFVHRNAPFSISLACAVDEKDA